VTVATCPGVRAGIKDEQFDIGLLLEVDAPEGQTDSRETATTILPALSAQRVVVVNSVGLVVFSSPFHPLILTTSVIPVPVTELAEYPLFMSDAAGDFHTLVSRFFESDGIPGPHLEASGSVEAVKRAVAADTSALGILPAYAIADELQTGDFAVLSLRPPPPRMRLEALLSKHRARHPAVTELIDSIRDGILTT
jgi:DNA-binding transcriptional LysR family regulator